MNTKCLIQKTVGMVVAVLLTVACGKANTNNFGTSSAAPQAIGSASLEAHDFAAVVKLVTPSGKNFCSGSFINGHTVLTAAHCLTEDGMYKVQTSFGEFQTATKFTLGDEANDIGVLTFSEEIAKGDQILTIGTSVEQGDALYVVGFGCNNLDSRTGGGVKRQGANRVSQITEFVELLSDASTARAIAGSQTQSATCAGDSGGAGIKKNTDGTYSLVGVIHGGANVGSTVLSQLVNITRADNSDFINQVR